MAHFAKLENNIVTDVVAVLNDDILDGGGNESEDVGISFLRIIFGQDTVWKQTSYNNNIRKKYASIGDTYRQDLDAFIAPQIYPSWTLNEETCEWEPPVAQPPDTETTYHWWDEENQQWVEASMLE